MANLARPRGMPFQQDQPDRDGDQHERDLRRALAISHAVPGPVDRRRESVDAVILDGAEIGERLQQGERRAGRDGRPGQRQADAQESPPRSVAQDAAGFEQRLRLRQERRAGCEIDIGVQDQREQERDARCRAEIGEPVIGARPSGRAAQSALERSGEGHQVGIGVADDVGRHHEGQQQRPLQDADARETAHRDQPSGPGAEDDGSDTDAQQQDDRVGEDVRKLGLGEVTPEVELVREQAGADAEQRQRHHGRNDECAQPPDHGCTKRKRMPSRCDGMRSKRYAVPVGTRVTSGRPELPRP